MVDKIAFLTSHVIQYQGPLFKEIAKKFNLRVFFCSKKGLNSYNDKEFGKKIKWSRNLLEGYDYVFLKNYSFLKKEFFKYMNFGLFKELKKFNPDVVILYGYGWFFSWYALLCSKILKIPVFLIGDTNFLNNKKTIMKKIILIFFFNNCKGFLSVGRLNQKYYLSFKQKNIFHCPFSVDNKFFISKSNIYKNKRKKILNEFNLPNKKIILFTGKLIPKKAPFDLIKAHNLMRKKNDCIVVFAGDGELKSKMYNKAGDSVFLLGFLNQEEITKIYSVADIFVFPSRFEPFGLALNEAMCFSLPVVCSSSVSSAYDLVRGNGYIYKTGDISSLANYLDKLIENNKLRNEMGKKSLKLIKNWSYKETVEGISEAIESIKS